jgi:hypothetical protein
VTYAWVHVHAVCRIEHNHSILDLQILGRDQRHGHGHLLFYGQGRENLPGQDLNRTLSEKDPTDGHTVVEGHVPGENDQVFFAMDRRYMLRGLEDFPDPGKKKFYPFYFWRFIGRFPPWRD